MANQVTVSNDHSINVTIEPPANVQVLVSRAVIGTVANVASANTANTVVNNAQPNITSVGTLTSLTSSGNITAPFFIGNVVGNISGNFTVPGSNTAVLFNQTGNAGASDALKFDYASNVLTANGNIVANYYIGNGSQLTGIVTQQSNNANFANVANIANAVAGANVTGIVANANYSAFSGIAGVANSVAVANVSGIGNIATVNLDGNAGNILFGNGIFAAVPNVANVANANYANFAGEAFSVNASNIVGTVNLANFATTANSVAGANVSGAVANATYANTSGSANTAGTVTTNAQPNITSVGTLTGLVVSGNITPNANITYDLGNNTNRFKDLYLAGNSIILGAQTLSANATGISVTGNLSGDASGLSNISGANVTGTVANANYSAYSGIAGTANSVAGANVSGAVAFATTANSVAVGNVSGIGNIATVNLDGNVSNLLTGSGTFVAIPTVSSNANYANFAGEAFSVTGSNVSGTVANANYSAYSGIAGSANSVAGANVTGQVANALVSGTVYTNTQPNITSVGTLTSLDVTGNITGFANITGDYFLGNGAFLTGVGNFSAALGYHGSFFSNVTQTIASTTTAYPITLNNTSPGTYGVSVTSNSRVTFTYAGTYNIQYSIQFTNTDNAIHNASVWLRKNGVDVPDTNSLFAVTARHGSTDGQLIGAINYIEDVSANDYYELIWQAESTSVSLEYIGPGTTPTSPATPSAIVTAMQVTNVQAATLSGNLTGDLIGNTYGLTGTSFVNIIGNISGNVFTGNGSGLTQLTGANVSGQVANALIAGTVYTNAQPNITSLGNLTGLTINNTVGTAPTLIFAPNGTSFTTNYAPSAGTTQVGQSSRSGTGTPANAVIRTRGTISSPLTVGTSDTVNLNTYYAYNGNINALAATYTIRLAGSGTLNTGANAVYTGATHSWQTGNPWGDWSNISAISGLNTLTFNTQGTLLIAPGARRTSGADTGSIRITDYGTVSGAQFAGGINIFKARGNADATLGVQPDDDIGSFTFTPDNGVGTTAAAAGLFVKVDSSYVANTANVPLNFVIGAVNSSNTAVYSSFYGNGTASFPGLITTSSNANVGGLNVTGISSLGNVGNVKITGGTANYVLKTDGTGNLDWVAQTGGGDANFANYAGNVTVSAQSNITSLGTLTGLSVTGVTNLGAVGNVIVTGGTNGYVLSTNGSGNLSWVAQSGGGGSSATDFTPSFLLGGM